MMKHKLVKANSLPHKLINDIYSGRIKTREYFAETIYILVKGIRLVYKEDDKYIKKADDNSCNQEITGVYG